MTHEHRGQRDAGHTADQETRLNRGEVLQNALGHVAIGAFAFGHRLQAGFAECVEANAHRCKQRAETHAADNRGGQLYTWNVQELESF